MVATITFEGLVKVTQWRLITRENAESTLQRRRETVRELREQLKYAGAHDKRLPHNDVELQHHVASIESTVQLALELIRDSPGVEYWLVGPLWDRWPSPWDRGSMERFSGRVYSDLNTALVVRPHLFLKPQLPDVNLQVNQPGSVGIQAHVADERSRS